MGEVKEHIYATYANVLCKCDRPNSPLQNTGADELSEGVQDFYHILSERLHTQFKGTTKVKHSGLSLIYAPYQCSVSQLYCHPCKGSSDAVDNIMDEVEKYMMTRLYKEVFCPETTDDEKKDLAIQKRIRSDTNTITGGRISNWQMTNLLFPWQGIALGDH